MIHLQDLRGTSAVRLAMVVVALAFAALYGRSAGPYWKLSPDSTTYVLGAQSIAEGHGYREAGHPAVLFPPGTSTLMAIAWMGGGKSYRALNAEVILFALAAMAVCFFLFRNSLGTLGSGAVVLLCLGSAELFDNSTNLLSEIFFVFFSLLTFWSYQRGRTLPTALAATAAVAVRSVGVCLGFALVVDSLRHKPRRWGRAAAYSVPLLFQLLWEWRNRRLGWSYSALMTQNQPWVPASGHISPGRLLSRLLDNLAYARAAEDLLTNGWTEDLRWAAVPGLVLGALMAIGFWRTFCRGNSPRQKLANGNAAMGIYSIAFLITVALYWPSVVPRLLLPLLPFFFVCIVAGVQNVAERTSAGLVYAVASVALVVYLVAGVRAELPILADSLSAPFPGERVRYVGNEDLQGMALWWKGHANPDDLYACQHPQIVRIVTGREGILYPVTGQPEILLAQLRAGHASYLLLNFKSSADRAIASVAEQSGKFQLIQQLGNARLYRLASASPVR